MTTAPVSRVLFIGLAHARYIGFAPFSRLACEPVPVSDLTSPSIDAVDLPDHLRRCAAGPASQARRLKDENRFARGTPGPLLSHSHQLHYLTRLA